MRRKAPLHKFFAVTATSVYRVLDRDRANKGQPSVKKVALRHHSSIRVGERLATGMFVGICRGLLSFTFGQLEERRRRVVDVRKLYIEDWNCWMGTSSAIIALFKTRKAADKCLGSHDLKPSDPRWERCTRRVVAQIGTEHPVFYVLQRSEMSMDFFAGRHLVARRTRPAHGKSPEVMLPQP